jgi:hypothetical protein
VIEPPTTFTDHVRKPAGVADPESLERIGLVLTRGG